jgi:hypothetical protein
MKNETFKKSLALLTHPFGLSMLALLLVNDHILRKLWPSWWTGKLGDFAWLGFFPFALAALLSWVLPLSERNRERWVGSLAFGLTGAVFTLGKTLPFFHNLIVLRFEAIFGVPCTLVRDPSDLIALPALWIGWRLWRLPAKTNPIKVYFQRHRANLRLAALSLAALLTIANAVRYTPNQGILCLAAESNWLYARPYHLPSMKLYYGSNDGGLTWSETSILANPPCENKSLNQGDWQEIEDRKSGLTFRYFPGEPIQSSENGGQNWVEVYHPSQPSEAMWAYVAKSRADSPTSNPGPFDAIQDPTSGNILFAMGQEGVLVHTASGEWRMVAVGEYRIPVRPNLGILIVLLGEQLILSFITALLVFVILAILRLKVSGKYKPILMWALLVAAGIIWLAVVLVFPPTINTNHSYLDTGLMIIGLPISGILLVVLALAVSVTLYRIPAQPPLLPCLSLAALAGGVLFFLPSLLWAYNILPESIWALRLSLLLVTAVIAIGVWKLPRAQKPLSPDAL